MKDSAKKLYVTMIIMLFCAVGIILIGMFKVINPESAVDYESELSKSQVFNQNAQQNISALIEENEALKRELNERQDNAANLHMAEQAQNTAGLEEYKADFSALSEVWKLITQNKKADAKNMLSSVDRGNLNEHAQIFYDALSKLL